MSKNVKPVPTQEHLIAKYRYDKRTGSLLHRFTTKKVRAGSIAGWIDRTGYRKIQIGNKKLSVHRLVWVYHFGSFPNGHLDHVNRNKLDNRIENLREVSAFENMQNRFRKPNPIGFRGCVFIPRHKKWLAKIMVNRKSIHLGHFVRPEEAQAAYFLAKEKYHKCKISTEERKKN